MPITFDQSRTRDNLMRAFAGESQARNRYTFAAGQARAQSQAAIAWAFEFTAGQEKEHAEIFFNFLAPMAGRNILIDGRYPVEAGSDLAALLRSAAHNESEESRVVYPAFAKVASDEGFPDIADAFTRIAAIEQIHCDRFTRFADRLGQNTLFESRGMPCAWTCLNCGHTLFGESAPEQCPVCHHAQGYFLRATLTPFVQ